MRKIAAAVLATLIALIAFDLYPRTMPVYGQTYPMPPNVGLLAARPTFCANTGQQYYATDNTTLYYATVAGTSCTWTAVGGTSGGSGFPQFALYTFSVSAGTVSARNNLTGTVDFSGSDVAAVVNSVLTANATVGGHLLFKAGVYNVNSMTVESATGCSSFESSGAQLAYAFGFPSNTPYSSSVQWYIEGETAPVWQGEAAQVAANVNGVIFNITSTAVSSVTAGSVLAGFWQRPVTNCTLTASNVSNEIVFSNIGVRFPVNTRGNEVAFAPYFAGTVEYGPHGAVVADFAVPYNTIETGSAPTVGTWNSIGMTSTVSSSGNWQDFRDTYVVGYNLAYDFQSEHVTGTTLTAIYNNIACEFGRSGTAIFHPSKIDNFIDQENAAGCIFGPQIQQGTFFDIYFDFEFGNDANWYTAPRAGTAKLSETNNGYATGIIRYQAVLANSGVVAEIPAASLFSSGGVGFQEIEATQNPNLAVVPSYDAFTRPNTTPTSGTNGLGPAWANGTQAGANNNLKIVSNSARNAATGGTGTGFSLYLATAFNADQFSRATCSILVSAVNACEVLVRGSTNPAVQTYYSYFDGGNAATGRGVFKVVAGVSTTLASQTSSGGAPGDVLELDVIGNTLWAYRNGALDTSFTNPVTDSSITSGSPGLLVLDAALNGAAMTNWQGGSFPTKTGTDSVYANPAYSTMYLSSGVAPTPTGTGACATITTQVPASIGSTAGTLKCTGTTGASTITLTFPAAQAAPNGWRCSADDETTVADRPNQTSSTHTTCVLTTAATASNDVIIWNASPF